MEKEEINVIHLSKVDGVIVCIQGLTGIMTPVDIKGQTLSELATSFQNGTIQETVS
jgi:hypothetical protein